jgi:hypothetical protein
MALLVYDMQIGIKSQVKEGDAIVGKIRQILEVARAARLRIFFTRHMSLPKELMGAFQFRMAMTWQRVDDRTVVSARRTWLRNCARTAAASERSYIRQTCHVSIRRHPARLRTAGLRHHRGCGSRNSNGGWH